MSGITHVERGARQAHEAALAALHPDLFPDMLPDSSEWFAILNAAQDQLTECEFLREAMRA